jgi:hypothetical protein
MSWLAHLGWSAFGDVMPFTEGRIRVGQKRIKATVHIIQEVLGEIIKQVEAEEILPMSSR